MITVTMIKQKTKTLKKPGRSIFNMGGNIPGWNFLGGNYLGGIHQEGV